eukprot:m.117316 g.117316  ORF g.117316 m.117316 type:complete len:509 (+) comp15424_c0_seq2:412-1938(+)
MMQLADEEPSTYFWFDLVCNNQVSTTALPHDFWSHTFSSAIESIGRVVAVLSPWNDPVPLRRAWCLWEINCGLKAPVFEVRLPESQAQLLQQGMLTDFGALPAALARIDAEQAEASKPEDKDLIAATIRRDIGFHAFNSLVKDRLRQWYLSTADRTLEQFPDKTSLAYANLCSQVAVVQGQFDRAAAAEGNLEQALTIYRSQLSPHDLRVISAVNNLAGIHLSAFNNDKAEALLDQASRLLENAMQTDGPLQPASSPTPLLPTIAPTPDESALTEMSSSHSSATLFETDHMHDLLVADVSSHNPRLLELWAAILNNRGKLLDAKREHTAAAEAHKQVLEILTNLHEDACTPIATCLNNIGTSLHGAGHLSEAMSYHKRALDMRETLLGRNHVDVANSLQRLADAETLLKDYDSALTRLERALSIKSANLGQSHPDVVRIKALISAATKQKLQHLRATPSEPPHAPPAMEVDLPLELTLHDPTPALEPAWAMPQQMLYTNAFFVDNGQN